MIAAGSVNGKAVNQAVNQNVSEAIVASKHSQEKERETTAQLNKQLTRTFEGGLAKFDDPMHGQWIRRFGHQVVGRVSMFFGTYHGTTNPSSQDGICTRLPFHDQISECEMLDSTQFL